MKDGERVREMVMIVEFESFIYLATVQLRCFRHEECIDHVNGES